jgi:hypothetical protein
LKIHENIIIQKEGGVENMSAWTGKIEVAKSYVDTDVVCGPKRPWRRLTYFHNNHDIIPQTIDNSTFESNQTVRTQENYYTEQNCKSSIRHFYQNCVNFD